MRPIDEIEADVAALAEEVESYEPLPPDAKLRRYLDDFDASYRLGTTTNRLKAKVDELKRHTKRRAIDKFEEEEIDGAPTTIGGERVRFDKYDFRQARITNYAAFKRWAEEQEGETYFEPERKVRAELVNNIAKSLEDDKQPLPPGVTMWRETRLSRTVQGQAGTPLDEQAAADRAAAAENWQTKLAD